MGGGGGRRLMLGCKYYTRKKIMRIRRAYHTAHVFSGHISKKRILVSVYSKFSDSTGMISGFGRFSPDNAKVNKRSNLNSMFGMCKISVIDI